MPRIKWKKSELLDGLKPTFGTLISEAHGPDEILRHERELAVKKWEESLAPHEQKLVPCLRGESTHERAATELGMTKRTLQRRVQALRESARRALDGVRP